MMRRIELLPDAYLQRRKQRRQVAGIIAGGVVVLALLLAYWLTLGTQIGNAREELTAAQDRNASLQVEIDSLQRFAELEREVNTKRGALAQVMEGDVDWPGFLTEIALVLPGEIWFRSVAASAGGGDPQAATATEPTTATGTDAFGQAQFTGSSLSMRGVAKWLTQLRSVTEFHGVWLNDAVETEVDEATIFNFDATVKLNNEAASGRFQEAP